MSRTNSLFAPDQWVIFVEANPPRRLAAIEVLRSAGLKKASGAESLKDAHELIVREGLAPAWIFAPEDRESGVNIANLLEFLVSDPRYAKTRTTLLCSEQLPPWLSHAFELGLFSYFHWTGIPNDLAAALEDTKRLGDFYEWDDCAIAATYLRRYLLLQKNHEDLLRFEQSLLATKPQTPDLPVHLAEALHLNARDDAALSVLNRSTSLTPEGKVAASNLRSKLASKSDDASLAAFAQEWGLRRAVVVEPDTAVANFIKETLQKMGVPEVQAYSQGDEAWNQLRQCEEPDLIVQEWRIAKLSGAALLQRIRAHGFSSVPIIIHSTLVGAQDRVLLRELGASDVIPKPLGHKELAAALMNALKEEKRPKDIATLERNTRKAVGAGDLPTAKQLLEKLRAHPKASPGPLKALEAELAFGSGQLQKANRLGIEALQISGEDVLIFNLLGKIYMKMRLFDQAAKFFERADKLSPGNVQRLCDLAESQLENGQSDVAEKRLAQAKNVDAGNEAVLAADAKVALAKGESPDLLRGLMGKVEDPSGVAAFMNNRAVTMVNNRQLKEAIQLYQNALAALPKKLEHLRPTITYNLALAQIRQGDLDAARWQLAKVGKDKGTRIASRASSLLARAAEASKRGEPLVLQKGLPTEAEITTDEDIEEESINNFTMPSAIDAQPGSMRCHMVFKPQQRTHPEFVELLANPPPWRRSGTKTTAAPKSKARA